MKFLFDLFPVILFFLTAKVADSNKDWAAAFATHYFGVLVSGGAVGPEDAPVLLSTVVVIAATVVQIGWLLARRQKVHIMLWTSAVLIIVLGSLTIWLHSSMFVKWKPTALYWVFAAALGGTRLFTGRNLIHTLIGEEIKDFQLPEVVWSRLSWAWTIFFLLMGFLNLYVAFNYSFSTWASFKAFGSTGLMLAFAVGQAVYLGRHMHEPAAATPIDAGTALKAPSQDQSGPG